MHSSDHLPRDLDRFTRISIRPANGRRHVLHIGFAAFAAICLWGLVRDRRELALLRVEAARLEPVVGRLEIGDPEQIAVLKVADRLPEEILWRVYFPAGHPWRISYRSVSGGGGSNHSSGSEIPIDTVFRCRLTNHQGAWRLFVVHSSGSGSAGLSPATAKFVQEHWDALRIEVAANRSQTEFPVDTVVTLLSIDVPDELMATAKQQLEPTVWNKLQSNPLFTIEFGAEAAFQIRESLPQVNAAGGAEGG